MQRACILTRSSSVTSVARPVFVRSNQWQSTLSSRSFIFSCPASNEISTLASGLSHCP